MRSIMKLLFVFALTGLVISCKKSSSPDTNYYLKANFDGNAKTFNTSVIAAKSNLGTGIYNLSIVGLNGTTEEGALELWSDKDDFTAGKTFTLKVTVGGSETENVFAYTAPLGSSDPSNIWTTTFDLGVVDETFTCTITEATSTYIKGTFSTVIYENIESPVTSKKVTEGQFYAKY
jgi:hypothetical protein